LISSQSFAVIGVAAPESSDESFLKPSARCYDCAMRNLKRIVICVVGAVSLGFSAGCAGSSCSDYSDNLFGPPPGCECLDNAYGCGAFDYPTGYGYAQQSSAVQGLVVRAAAKKTASAGDSYKLQLTQRSSTCPNIAKGFSADVVLSAAAAGAVRRKISNAQFGSVTLRRVSTGKQSGRSKAFSGSIARRVPMLAGCNLALNLQFNGLPQTGAAFTKNTAKQNSGTVAGKVTCSAIKYSCAFVYDAVLARSL